MMMECLGTMSNTDYIGMPWRCAYNVLPPMRSQTPTMPKLKAIAGHDRDANVSNARRCERPEISRSASVL